MRRLASLFLTVLLAVVLAPTAALAHDAAQADPDSITVDGDNTFASWSGGTYAVPVTFAGCPGPGSGSDVCDYLTLTVAVDGQFWSDLDGGVTITIANDDGADFDLTVYDGDGTEIATSETAGDDPETIFLSEPAGTYTIEVTPWLVEGPSTYEGSVMLEAEEAANGGGPAPTLDDVIIDEPCVDGMSANLFPCDGFDLAAFIPITTLGARADGDEGSDVWGWTDPDTDREYAIMGIDNGTTFVDVTDPFAPVVLGFMDNPSPTPSIWHDYKIIGNFVYAVAESNAHDLQIVDLTRLRDLDGDEVATIEPDATLDLVPGDSHNLAVNEDSGRIYSVGTNACDGGPLVYDVDSNGGTPTDPAMLGCIAEDGYTHDAQCITYDGPDADHTGKEICVNSNEDTLTVVDATEVGLAGQDTEQLARMPYENASYSHQGWFTEDRRYFLLGDELDEQDHDLPTTTYIWDMTDLDAPVLVNNFEHDNTSIDHNLYVKGDLVYMSNYTSGLRLMDLSRVDEGILTPRAFFDVFPRDDEPTFDGTWSNYPYFDSGTIVVSGYQGMWLLKPSGAAGGVERLAGDDRIATAVEISKATFDTGVDVAYVATGFGFADALTGGPLAAANDAPILLTEPTTLSAATRAELARLQPGRIVVLGGEAAVSADVANDLATLTDGEVSRLAGDDRYGTAAAIAGAYPDAVDGFAVATGQDFPDALAGGALAAALGQPILLTEPTTLPAATVEVLDGVQVDDITVLGGDQVVSNAVAVRLADYATVSRLSGADRFDTMRAIVDAFPTAPETVYVTTGFGFADAVAGIPAVAADDAALVLVGRDEIPAAADAVLSKLSPSRIVVLGGPAAVSVGVEDALAAYLG